MKKQILFFSFLLGALLPLSAYAWGIEGHVIGINGSSMPAYFWFQMDADSEDSTGSIDGNCYAQEPITYDGSYSGTTVSSNNKVIYSQVLAALLAGKLVRVSGSGGHTAGNDCLAQVITTYSQTE